MLWFFDREDESLRRETRYDTDRSEFVAGVTHPDGSERMERSRRMPLSGSGLWSVRRRCGSGAHSAERLRIDTIQIPPIVSPGSGRTDALIDFLNWSKETVVTGTSDRNDTDPRSDPLFSNDASEGYR